MNTRQTASEPLPASDLFGSADCGESRPAPPKANSPKQRAIIADVKLNGQITLAEATALVGRNVYANADKHTGALLANMVKKGLLVRIKPGVFSLSNDLITHEMGQKPL
jgi:hypothetical protein